MASVLAPWSGCWWCQAHGDGGGDVLMFFKPKKCGDVAAGKAGWRTWWPISDEYWLCMYWD